MRLKPVDVLEGKPLSLSFYRYGRPVLWLAAMLAAVLIFWPARTLRSDNFILYLPEGARTIPIQSVGRVDYLLSEKHSMYGRYYIYNFLQPSVFDGTNALTTTTAGTR